jgi:DNA-binding MarR family transcriptional regulator
MLKDSLGYKINLTATLLKTEFTKRLKPKCGIATEQFATLQIISEDDQITQTKIAERLGKNKTTIGRSIDSLIKKGLLVKQYTQDDKRVHRISLTSQAQEILENAVPLAQNFNTFLKSKFTQEELKIFFKMLETLSEEIHKNQPLKGQQ